MGEMEDIIEELKGRQGKAVAELKEWEQIKENMELLPRGRKTIT